MVTSDIGYIWSYVVMGIAEQSRPNSYVGDN